MDELISELNGEPVLEDFEESVKENKRLDEETKNAQLVNMSLADIVSNTYISILGVVVDFFSPSRSLSFVEVFTVDHRQRYIGLFLITVALLMMMGDRIFSYSQLK